MRWGDANSRIIQPGLLLHVLCVIEEYLNVCICIVFKVCSSYGKDTAFLFIQGPAEHEQIYLLLVHFLLA